MKNLSPNEIHVWIADANDFEFAQLMQASQSWLSQEEKQRVERFQFEEHKKQLVLGRYFLRSVLSEYGITQKEQWRFRYNDYGKPQICAEQQSHPALFFNLSHSKRQFALAISRLEETGIDVEFNKRERLVSKIAKRFFSPTEVSALLEMPEQGQQQRFFELWTLKEAYIKACGLGLGIPLDQFSFAFESDKTLSLSIDKLRIDNADHWQIWQLASKPDYNLALAAKSAQGSQIELLKGFRFLMSSDSEIELSVLRSNH